MTYRPIGSHHDAAPIQWEVHMRMGDGRVLIRAFERRFTAERFIDMIPFNQVRALERAEQRKHEEHDWLDIVSARIVPNRQIIIN
jgi:hypothetical protein